MTDKPPPSLRGFGLLRAADSTAPDPLITGGLDPDIEIIELQEQP